MTSKPLKEMCFYREIALQDRRSVNFWCGSTQSFPFGGKYPVRTLGERGYCTCNYAIRVVICYLGTLFRLAALGTVFLW